MPGVIMVLRRAFCFREQSAGCLVYRRSAEQEQRVLRTELLGCLLDRAGQPVALIEEVGKGRCGGQDPGRILSRPGGQRVSGSRCCEHLGGEVHADGNGVEGKGSVRRGFAGCAVRVLQVGEVRHRGRCIEMRDVVILGQRASRHVQPACAGGDVEGADGRRGGAGDGVGGVVQDGEHGHRLFLGGD
jgi:hypothetical protein